MTRTATLKFGDQTIELPVIEGSEGELAVDISQLRAKTGLITLDPGFGNTGACKSEITFIDGEKGILRYRGIPIEQLAEHSSFVETAWLLIFGKLPTQTELDRFRERLTAHAPIHEAFKHHFAGLPRQRAADGDALGDDQHPLLLPPRPPGADRGGALRGSGAADQQGPHDRGLLVPPVARDCRSSIPTRSCATWPTSST